MTVNVNKVALQGPLQKITVVAEVASAADEDYLLLSPPYGRKYKILRWAVWCATTAPTAGDISLEIDDGTDETAIASIDFSDITALTPSEELIDATYRGRLVEAGEWLQVRINPDTTNDFNGSVMVEFQEIEA